MGEGGRVLAYGVRVGGQEPYLWAPALRTRGVRGVCAVVHVHAQMPGRREEEEARSRPVRAYRILLLLLLMPGQGKGVPFPINKLTG
eukprot:2162617-Prymnesium_polylepis.1